MVQSFKSPFRRRKPFSGAGVIIPVLTLVEDGLEEASPFYSMSSSAAGTLTWDFHSSATPPAAGAGDHLTGTQAIGSGITVWDTDLSAAAGETGYIHYRVTNSAGTSNILTSQQITVPSDWAVDTTFGADLLGWWDASDAGSLSLTGSDVTQWNDLSGNSEHLTQGTASRYPQYSATSFNSHPGLTFSDDYLLCSSFANVSDGTITFVAIATMDNTTTNNNGRLIGCAASGGLDYNAPNGIAMYKISSGTLSGYRGGGLGTQTVTDDLPSVFISEFGATDHTMYVNNVAGTPVTHNANWGTNTQLIVGTNYATVFGADYWHGVVAEIFIINRALTSQERSDIQTYAAIKWGV